jgi:biotin carboxyl carrier protein
MRFEVQLASSNGTRTHAVDLERLGDQWRIILDGEPVDADVVEIAPNTLSILLPANPTKFASRALRGTTKSSNWSSRIYCRGQTSVPGPVAVSVTSVEGRQQITAPMAGKVVHVLVKPAKKSKWGRVCWSWKP